MNVLEIALSLSPAAITLLVAMLVLWAANQLLLERPKALDNSQRFYRQLGMLGLTVAMMLAVVMALPVAASTRNQVIGLLGLVISSAIAFSSTNILANLMAGVMLRVTKPFRTGDFIRVGEDFGRVTERGLLDTELQTDSRELVALPNSYLITRPVSVVRSSGAVVSVTLSLGYDVHHSRIDALLAEAAQRCNLTDPYVQIVELGDHAVTYRINGLLEDVKGLLTARSKLNRAVLDALHDHGVEIVSPRFVNLRELARDTRIIPAADHVAKAEPERTVEDIVFDKAEEAETREQQRQALREQIETIEASLKTAAAEIKETLDGQLAGLQEQLNQLDQEGDDSKPKPRQT